MIGKTLGKYRIVEKIGRGGMAEVYKAYHPDLDRYVAVKIMHSFLADEQGFADRFRREARSVARLRHTNIVHVYDFDAGGDVTYMVMELIEGPSLKNRLAELEAQGQWLTLEEAVRIVRDVGEALDYAHRRKMVHRDVKPANVMLTKDGEAILTDFGIVKMLSATSATQLTASGAMIGTPAYLSPEQCKGAAGDERADIYSLGIVLYQLATGRLPYDADTPLAIVFKHVNDPLPIPSALNPDLPQGVERIILKALAKDPDDRYQSVREMLDHLDRAMRGGIVPEVDPAITMASQPIAGVPTSADDDLSTPIPPGRAAVARPGAPPARRPPRWLLGLAGLILVAALAVVGFLALGGKATPTPEPAEIAMATATATSTSTSQPTKTATPPAPSATEDRSPTPEATQTHTPSPSPTSTETPTVTPSPTNTETPTPSPTTPTADAVVLAGGAELRPGADTWWYPRQTLSTGTELKLAGYAPAFPDWVFVRTADGSAEGWTQIENLQLNLDLAGLPRVTPRPTLTPASGTSQPPSPTPGTCQGGPLTMTFYADAGTEQCVPGSGWSVNFHFIVSGGNCVYTYFWEGEQIYGPTTESEFIYTVYWGDAALTGTGRVESGGETVQEKIFVPKPPQCP